MKIMNFYNRLRASSTSTLTAMLTLLMLTVFQYEALSQCALACNDRVFVSLDDGCQAVIEPNLILEGDEMECAGEMLTVEITDNFGNNFGNTVTEANIGQILNVSVISSSGNSCWGTLVVEDKYPPALVCEDVYTTCSGSLVPGSPISGSVSYAADVTTPDIPNDMAFDETFNIDVIGLQNATVNDINFYLVLDHDNLSDLTVMLDHPNDIGGPVTLFSGLSATCNSGMLVTIDDDATKAYAALQGGCSNGVVLKGSFQGATTLDTWVGIDPVGTWTVRVVDNNFASGGGTIKKLVLVLGQTGGIVTFPGTGITVLDQNAEGTQFTLLGLDACGEAVATIDDNEIEQDCDSPYSKVIERTWNAVDEQGNISVPCVQTIYVYRNDLSTVIFPPNYDGMNGNPGPLSCSLYGNTIPDSTVTGYPMGEICENIQIFPYKDQILDICPGSYKILREWKVIEWCSGEILTHSQIIKVEDTEGPEITPIADITISTDIWECHAIYEVPLPEAFDACSSVATYELSYQYADLLGDVNYNGVFSSENVEVINGRYIINFLPLGRSLVKWRLTDECDQTSEDIFEVWVEDQVPPVAVCDEFTVASLGSDGWAEVAALTFDDLSHDNCEIVKWEARKMTDACGINNTLFRDTVKFCCAEVNTSVMVEFRVTDSSGNSNTCMVEVKVQDKLPPFIYCPPNVTIDCFEDINDVNLVGTVIPGVDAIDNCGIPTVTHEDDDNIDQCGEGIVRRTWTATDAQGLKYTCEQIITLDDLSPFNEEDDIIWADDYVTDQCEGSFAVEDLEPPYIPVLSDDNCSLVAITYEDQEFYIVRDACEKIIRTWTVIDWCTYDPRQQGVGLYTDIQVLKKINEIAPTFSNCEDREIPAYNQDCSANVEIGIDAFDDCTPVDEIMYTYYVDLNNDGIFNFTGSGNTIIDVWGLGQHKVKWQAEDRCGNISTCVQIINVVDKKKPTPYCITSLTTVVMNEVGMVEVWARDFDFGSSDNCTAQRDLLFTFNNARPRPGLLNEVHYFKGDALVANEAEYLAGNAQKWLPDDNTSGMVFNCNDLPNGKSATIPVDMTVWDETGNRDYCSVILELQDNVGNACEGTTEENRAYISGRIMTEENNYVDDVDVQLQSSMIEMIATVRTQNDGEYLFNNLVMGESYDVDGEKAGEFLNGVSTLDIVMIQRHILGIELLSTPYKIVASDVDNNNRVSSSDIIGLRKAILGISSKFPNDQKSWRFIDRDYVFADNINPFPYENGIVYNNLSGDMTGQDMIAVKIGDVNNNAKANARQVIQSRSDEKVILTAPKVMADRGSRIEVPVYGEMKALLGIQFTLDYDPGLLQFTNIVSGSLDITVDNFGTNYEKEGLVTFSWNDVEVRQINEDALFILEFEVLEDINEGIDLTINSALTQAEAYMEDGTITGIELIQTESEGAGFVLLQNAPNPFSEFTRIDFRLPEATQVTLEITDVSGKVIKRISQQYPEGYNSIQINNDELSASGVMYYTLRAGKHMASKKMVSIK